MGRMEILVLAERSSFTDSDSGGAAMKKLESELFNLFARSRAGASGGGRERQLISFFSLLLFHEEEDVWSLGPRTNAIIPFHLYVYADRSGADLGRTRTAAAGH